MPRKFEIILVLTAFFSAAAPGALSARSNDFSGRHPERPAVIEDPRKSLEVGERLVFEVFWMGVPVGEGTLEVKEKVRVHGRPAFHLVAVARTNDFLSKIYPVYDEVHSYLDAERFYSLEFRKNVREGRYRADERIIFDHGKKKGFYESFRNHGKKEIELVPGAQDLLSAFYWFRLQPVTVGKSVKAVVSSDEKNWDLELEVQGWETKELRGGEIIPTFVVEPKTRLKGILYRRGRAWVNFSCDSARRPIWITLKTPFGPVVGVLKT